MDLIGVIIFEIIVFMSGLVIGAVLGIVGFVELINWSMSQPVSVEHNAQTIGQLVEFARREHDQAK